MLPFDIVTTVNPIVIITAIAIFVVLLSLAFVVILLVITYMFCKLTTARCTCHKYLRGKTAIITGGSSGIGYETALSLAGRGCRVIIADKDNCDKVKDEIRNATGNPDVVVKYLNLASIRSIRQFAKDVVSTEERLDILINNAGTISPAEDYTIDELQLTMQVNHFGPFLLTHLLMDLLKKTVPSRIVFVGGSVIYLNNLRARNINTSNTFLIYAPIFIYANSQLCNIITTLVLSHKLKGTGITVNCVNPGLTSTPFFAHLIHSLSLNIILECIIKNFILRFYAKTAEEGAQSVIHVAISKKMEHVSGELYADCKKLTKPIKTSDCNFVKSIWEASEKYVGLTVLEQL